MGHEKLEGQEICKKRNKKLRGPTYKARRQEDARGLPAQRNVYSYTHPGCKQKSSVGKASQGLLINVNTDCTLLKFMYCNNSEQFINIQQKTTKASLITTVCRW